MAMLMAFALTEASALAGAEGTAPDAPEGLAPACVV
jgi:hypothetical protein